MAGEGPASFVVSGPLPVIGGARDTLHQLGLEGVNFEGSSDLRIEGRKLGALTAQDVVTCNSVGGFMNIKPPDLDLYLEVVRTRVCPRALRDNYERAGCGHRPPVSHARAHLSSAGMRQLCHLR